MAGERSDDGAAAVVPGPTENGTAKEVESKGELDYRVIENDGVPEHLEMLIKLKEVFHQQLPKMPKTYIVRLLFDRRHKSLALLKDGVPIGGISYRPFYPQKVGEITFCAVSGSSQVKGYGSLMMNQLKEHAKKEGITHLHTYADNYAIMFFQKQGFTKTVGMARDRWQGYIKEYEGACHMECYLHPTVDYINVRETQKRQWDEVVGLIMRRTKARCTQVHKGLPGLKEGAAAALMNPLNIPGVKEAGWTELNVQVGEKKGVRVNERDRVAKNKELLALLRDIMDKDYLVWPFKEAVDTKEAPDYYDIIKDPIDLSIIKKRATKGFYKCREMMAADLTRMTANCMAYNKEDTEFHKTAVDLNGYLAEKNLLCPKPADRVAIAAATATTASASSKAPPASSSADKAPSRPPSDPMDTAVLIPPSASSSS